MKPVVSIILPVFNRLKYLRETVDSVFNQSFLDWELLVADDGSGPETQNYLVAVGADLRVKVLWLAHSGNPAAVRNAALQAAAGEFVAFLDSDDVWARDKLQEQVTLLRNHTHLQWSYTGFTLIDGSGAPLPGRGGARGCAAIEGRIFDQILLEEALVVHSTVMVRRDLITRIGGYDETLLACEDYDLFLRLASCSEVGFIDEPLVKLRRHAEHSFDDVTCLQNLLRVIEATLRSGRASHLNALLTRRRAKIATQLARSYALNRNRMRTLATLLRSVHYSWRSGHWWVGSMSAMARAFTPQSALNAARRYRRRGRGRITI